MTLFAGLVYRGALKIFWGKGEGEGKGTRKSSLHQGNAKLMQNQGVCTSQSVHFKPFSLSSRNDQAQHHDA